MLNIPPLAELRDLAVRLAVAVGDGTADAYYEHVIQPWDIAAGALIAREAGAQTISGPGTSFPNGILAAAPSLAAALVELLAPSTPRRSV